MAPAITGVITAAYASGVDIPIAAVATCFFGVASGAVWYETNFIDDVLDDLNSIISNGFTDYEVVLVMSPWDMSVRIPNHQ